MEQRAGIAWLRSIRTAMSHKVGPLQVHAEWASGTPKEVVLAWLDDQLRIVRERQGHVAIKVTLHRADRAGGRWQEWVLASWSGYQWGMRDEVAMAVEGLLRREAIGLSLEPSL